MVKFPPGCPQGSSKGRHQSGPRGASSGICRSRVARAGLVPQQGHRAWGRDGASAACPTAPFAARTKVPDFVPPPGPEVALRTAGQPSRREEQVSPPGVKNSISPRETQAALPGPAGAAKMCWREGRPVQQVTARRLEVGRGCPVGAGGRGLLLASESVREACLGQRQGLPLSQLVDACSLRKGRQRGGDGATGGHGHSPWVLWWSPQRRCRPRLDSLPSTLPGRARAAHGCLFPGP